MSVDYRPLWKILVDRRMNKTQLIRAAGISPNTMARMGKGEPVHMSSIESICRVLGCTPNDIMVFVPEGEVQDGG